jgi:hypothetical protein
MIGNSIEKENITQADKLLLEKENEWLRNELKEQQNELKEQQNVLKEQQKKIEDLEKRLANVPLENKDINQSFNAPQIK